MGQTVQVARRPKCDFCGDPAYADGKTKMGPWANMCKKCFVLNGIGLGTGKGQKFIVPGEDENNVKR